MSMRQHQHPLFKIYTRDYLHEVTGFSKVYLSRLATGNTPITRSFINQVCYALNRPAEELFLLDLVNSQPDQEP